MIILDTDALSHMQKRDPVGVLIAARLDASSDRDVRITSVTAYEIMRGAVALINRHKKERRNLIPAFRLLQELVEYLGRWQELILPYEAAAEQIVPGFPARLRQELKDDAQIAAIALAYDAAVWTCNVDDYSRVPSLTVHRADTELSVP